MDSGGIDGGNLVGMPTAVPGLEKAAWILGGEKGQ